MRVARTGSHILVWRAAQKAAAAAVALVIMQGLGPEGNGRYSLTLAIIWVLAALLSGGVGLASVPLLRAGRESVRRVLSAQLAWCAVVGAVLAVLAVGVRHIDIWEWFAVTLQWDGFVVASVVAAVFGLMVFESANYGLLAAGRVVVGTATAALRAAVLLGLMVGLVLVAGYGVVSAVVAFGVVQLVAGALLVYRAWTVAEVVPAAAAKRSLGQLVRVLVSRGWLGQLSALSYLLLLRLDQFLLESYLDVTAVGIYAAAVWAAELLWLVPEALNPLLVHSSADATSSERNGVAARAVRLGLGATALAAIVLAAVSGPLLALLRDGAFQPAIVPLRALLPGVVAFAPGVILAGDFIGRGRPQWNTQASAITVVANVLLCVVMIPRWGIVGAAWASSTAYALGSLIMLLRFRQLTGVSWFDLLVPRFDDLRH